MPDSRINRRASVRAFPPILAFALIALLSPCADAALSGTVITIAGNGSIGFSGDGGPATNAAFNDLQGLAFGPDGTLYIADSGNLRIRAIDPATGIIRTILGTGAGGAEGNGGPATNATISGIIGLATDRVRNALYLTDWGNNWVRKVNLSDGILTLYAGSGGFGTSGDGGAATLAELLFPIGAAADADGRLSFVDSGSMRIRRVNPVTGIITTIAGDGGAQYAGDGGPATAASFGNLIRLAADSAGNVFARDGDPNGTFFTVRQIHAASGLINTIVGGGTNAPGTGFATNMFFANITELAANDAGELFFANAYQVFKLNVATGLMAPFAGDGTNGFGGEGAPALSARFASITALAVAPGGGLVIADSDNVRIRYVVPESINLTNDSGQTSFTLPWVSALTGDLILENNASLTNINVDSLTNVCVVSIRGNLAASEVDLSSLAGAGSVFITDNTAATTISLGSLGSVAGEVDISGNTAAATVDLISVTNVGGAISLGGNTTAVAVDLSSLQSAGSVFIESNTSATVISLGSVTNVTGNVNISGNTGAAEIDLGSLSGAGDVTIESNALNAVVSLSGLTNYGCGAAEVTLTLNGGTVEMTNGLALCTNATLTGSTTVDGSVTNNGTIEPGSSRGRLNFTGNLHLGVSSRMNLEIGGVPQDDFDSIDVGGNVVLGGALTVRLLNSFADVMTNGASFTVLTGGSPLTGSFANVASGGTLATADGRGRFIVRYAGENTLRLTDLQILSQPPDQPSASSGTIITIAGNGSRGFSGDDGPATNAAITVVNALTVGPDGTIYLADGGNSRIRAIDPVTGQIRTVAGNGVAGNTGNGGPATSASISLTPSLAIDRTRNVLYLSEINHSVVRRINLNDGIINVFAGNGIPGFTGDGGFATAARLRPWGIATAADNKLSIAALFRVRQVNPVSGIITTIAGDETSNFSPDGLPALSTSFHGITELAADPAGNLFILEGFSQEPRFVRRIDVASGLVSTVAGGGTNAPGTGVATDMQFIEMFDIGVSAAGELFIAANFQLFRVDLTTGLVAPIAGDGIQGYGGDGGPALSARFNGLSALAVIPGGGVVVADSQNNRLRYIVPESINLTNDSGQTSFTLPWVSGLTGNLILENNASLTNINVAGLVSVTGDLVLDGNVSAGNLDLGSLESAGNLIITDNSAATSVDLSSLVTVSGNLTLEGNTSVGNLDLGSLESAGNVSVSGNTAAGVLDLSSLATVSGDLVLEGNTSAGNLDLGSLESANNVSVSGNTAAGDLDLGSLATVSGDLSIVENSSAGDLDLGSLAEVSGDLTIESNAPAGNLDLSGLHEYGCGTNEVTMTLDGVTATMTNGLTLCTNATLTGSTTVDGSVTNNGTIEPGSSPGQLNITGNLHLNTPSRLRLELGGYASNEFDFVNVGGSAVLGGTLRVTILNSFTNSMTNGASFTVLKAGAPLAGTFINVASGSTLITEDGRARFTVRFAGENELRLTNLELLEGGPAEDSDGDGMPDAWEDQFGLSKTNSADAALDLDGDGALNAAEFVAGTNPADPASAFRFISIQRETNGVRLFWSAVGGKSYRVQTNGTLPGNFVDSGFLITVPGTGELTTNIFDSEVVTNTRFYRLRLAP